MNTGLLAAALAAALITTSTHAQQVPMPIVVTRSMQSLCC
jgi:hypothetical protein